VDLFFVFIKNLGHKDRRAEEARLMRFIGRGAVVAAATVATAAVVLMIALTGCSSGNKVEQNNWENYDELIDSIMVSGDAAEREALLHEAEDMLMETGCVVPVHTKNSDFTSVPGLTGVYESCSGAKYFAGASLGDSSKISVGLTGEAREIDPAMAYDPIETTVAVNISAGLFKFGADGVPTPDLAAGYVVSEDGLSYTFTLREGLLWSNGTVIDAEDVKYSWERAAQESTGCKYAYLFDVIARDDNGKMMITSTDSSLRTFIVQLKRPCPYFIDLCATPAFALVNEYCVKRAKGYSDIYGNVLDAGAWTRDADPVVSGPYKFSSWTSGNSITLVKNEKYYDAENVRISEIKIYFGNREENTAAFAAGGLSLVDFVPTFDEETQSSSGHPQMTVNDGKILSSHYLCFNFHSKIFRGMTAAQAANLRRALSLLIDRNQVIETVGEGAVASTSIIPKDTPDGVGGLYGVSDALYAYADEKAPGYFSNNTEENLAEARRILAEIGLDADGDGIIDNARRFDIKYLTLNTPSEIKLAQCVQQNLAKVGIIVKLRAVREEGYLYERMIYSYDIVATEFTAAYPSATSFLELWYTGGAHNWAQLGAEAVKEENKNAY
jgi:oligopeptide transport system substrate-binding protein